MKKHVVGMTTDGTSVMKKLGQKSGIFQQLCHPHGSHGATIDVLYKQSHNQSSDGEDENEEDDIYEEEKIKDSNAENEGDDDCICDWVEDQSVDADVQLADDIAELIRNIPKIARFFHKSPMGIFTAKSRQT